MPNWVDLGRVPYRDCAELQRGLLEDVAAGRSPDTLLFVEHDPVLTLGANFHRENLLLTDEEYRQRGIQLEVTDRGGDVTYHGPKQLVIYPIFNVATHGKDLHKWLRDLEESIIRALRHWNLEGERFPPHTGVWVRGRKIAAIGIKVKKWVSMHGIALNCNNDLSQFDLIVPCGIQNYGVTSLTREVGHEVTTEDARPAVLEAFEEVFDIELSAIPKDALAGRVW